MNIPIKLHHYLNMLDEGGIAKRDMADVFIIISSIVVWIWTLIVSVGMIRLESIPDRIVLIYNFPILLVVIISILIWGVSVWMSIRRPRELYNITVLSKMRFRLSWLPFIIVISFTLQIFFPIVAANVIFLGIPAVMAWALQALYTEIIHKKQSYFEFYRDGLVIFFLFGLLYWGCGVYFTQAVGEHSGDEGHYLIQAHSLYYDGDLDLHNNFGDPKTVQRERVHISPNSLDDHWYSWHSPGLSFLLAPTVHGGIVWRHLILGFISGLGLAGMYWLARVIGSDRRSALLVVPLLGAGAFYNKTLTVYGLLFVFSQRNFPWLSMIPLVFCIGLLPWVQTRFIPISFVLLACYTMFSLLGNGCWGRKTVRLVVFVGACALLLGGYQYFQLQLFKDGLSYPVPNLLFSLPSGMWHTLASNRGILYMFPMFGSAFAAMIYLVVLRETRHFGICIFLLFMSVLLTSCATVWFTGGSSLPGRFLLVITPILVVALARVLSCSGMYFRGLSFYLGLIPVTLFVSQLIVLESFGKSFSDPYSIEAVHPLFKGLVRFFYDPYGTLELFPALSLYLVAMVLLPWFGKVPKFIQCLSVVFLVISFAVYSIFPPNEVQFNTARKVAFALERQKMNTSFVIVRGDTTEPIPILNVSNRFAGHKFEDVACVTSRDLGSLTHLNWISYPHLTPLSDWEGRDYKWAPLIASFPPGKGRRIFFLDAEIIGNLEVEVVVREGSVVHTQKRYLPQQHIRDVYTFKADQKGHIFILVRFFTGEGDFVTKQLAYSTYSEKLLENANLNLDPPQQKIEIYDY